ncbi:MAG: hypothetical protein GY866_26210 [Proteobacteria bacterium]|nr:hypothetical protein [Pseudomonadota bacterium]
MKLIEIAPVQTWIELENDINRRSGLDASVFNTDGVRITDNKNWANPLCPVIKANKSGQTFICAMAHTNIALMAMKSQKTVVEECDGGLLKLVAPIFIDDEFLGVIGGCGMMPEDGEIDSFYINKTTGIDEDEIIRLSEGIDPITASKAEATVSYMAEQVGHIIEKYKNQRN